MFSSCHLRTFAAAFGLLASVAVGQEQNPSFEELQSTIADLRGQNRTLQRSLTEANRTEQQASEQLAAVRLRLEALGKNLLDGGNDRLVQANADLAIAQERIADLEGAVMRLSAAVRDYLRQAVVSDPDARVRLETSLRELDSILGLGQKPRSDVKIGTLQRADIVSIDQESGMIVLNLGENQGAKIGMTFRLSRGQQAYGKAILADVRKAVSGAFIEQLDKSVDSPRPGDSAVLETE
jgi:DNA-binding FrmR family transcriptional regulator